MPQNVFPELRRPVAPAQIVFCTPDKTEGTLDTQSHLILTTFPEKRELLHPLYEWGNRGPEGGSDCPTPHSQRPQGKDPHRSGSLKACRSLRSTPPRQNVPSRHSPAPSVASSNLSLSPWKISNLIQSAPTPALSFRTIIAT